MSTSLTYLDARLKILSACRQEQENQGNAAQVAAFDLAIRELRTAHHIVAHHRQGDCVDTDPLQPLNDETGPLSPEEVAFESSPVATTVCARCEDTVLEGTINPSNDLCEECDDARRVREWDAKQKTSIASSASGLNEVAVESVCFYGEESPSPRTQVVNRIAGYHKIGKKNAAMTLNDARDSGMISERLGATLQDDTLLELTEKGLTLAVKKRWVVAGDAQWSRVAAIPEVPEESNEDELPESARLGWAISGDA